MKKYYHLTITRNDGVVFTNPLTLSEVSVIGQAARENKRVVVEVREMTLKDYKITFGK